MSDTTVDTNQLPLDQFHCLKLRMNLGGERREIRIIGADDDAFMLWLLPMQADAILAVVRDHRVTTHRFDGEDHFLFFRQRDEVLKLVAQWIAADSTALPPSPR